MTLKYVPAEFIMPRAAFVDSSTEELYRIKIECGSRELLSGERSAYLATDGTWLYYSNLSNGGYIYRMALDGRQKGVFFKESAKNLRFSGGWLYYQGWEDSVTYRLETLGAKVTYNESIKRITILN
ncbi:MAG: DUF5050 domain-containing protein [Bacillota bacterium]|nr:DUF5050 domain-containing protein [Bacillota bacterium]